MLGIVSRRPLPRAERRVKPHLVVQSIFGGVFLVALVVATLKTGDHLYAVTIGGVVPFSQAPVITEPKDQQTFTHKTILASGSCGNAYAVEIYDNDISVGSTNCDKRFSLQLSLLASTNTLIAKAKDSQGLYGPSSVPVQVLYAPAQPNISITTAPPNRPALFDITSEAGITKNHPGVTFVIIAGSLALGSLVGAMFLAGSVRLRQRKIRSLVQ